MNLLTWFQERPPRERLLLLITGPLLLCLAAFIIFIFIDDALTERQEKIAAMRSTLSLIQANQPKYLRDRARKATLDAKLGDRAFSPKTFLREQGTRLGLSVNATDGNRKAASVGAATDLIEQDIEVNFTQIDYNDLALYLDAISNADTPLYIKAISITRASTGRRGSSSNPPDERTPLNVNLTVVTFRPDDASAL